MNGRTIPALLAPVEIPPAPAPTLVNPQSSLEAVQARMDTLTRLFPDYSKVFRDIVQEKDDALAGLEPFEKYMARKAKEIDKEMFLYEVQKLQKEATSRGYDLFLSKRVR